MAITKRPITTTLTLTSSDIVQDYLNTTVEMTTDIQAPITSEAELILKDDTSVVIIPPYAGDVYNSMVYIRNSSKNTTNVQIGDYNNADGTDNWGVIPPGGFCLIPIHSGTAGVGVATPSTYTGDDVSVTFAILGIDPHVST
jgi:hypothetical protein